MLKQLLVFTAVLVLSVKCSLNESAENNDTLKLESDSLQSDLDKITPTTLYDDGDVVEETAIVEESDTELTLKAIAVNKGSDEGAAENVDEKQTEESNNETVSKKENDKKIPVDVAGEVSAEHDQSNTDLGIIEGKHVLDEKVVNKTASNISDDLVPKEDKFVNITTPISTDPTTTTTPTTTTISTTTKKATIRPPEKNDIPEEASFFKTFRLEHLYFLLLIIPLAGIIVGVYFYCKRRKKRGKGYTEATIRSNRTRRFSTPSWVFSEPDFVDEEVTTVEQKL